MFFHQEWDAKAEVAKKEYERAMREYKESGGGSSGSSKKYSKYSQLFPTPHFEWTFHLLTIILFQNMILALSNWLFLTIFPTFHSWREKKKKGGKNEEKRKRKSGGGREKEKERATGNDSFKSREFISSEESSSESDKGKGRKRKV